MRIIPARAGFTWNDDGTPVGGSDHPRSRGVYQSPAPTGPRRSGSSPLARGLRQGGQGPGAGGGIIPARAGFTERRGVHGPLQRDHPRSRGVYALGDAVRASHSGSSPLARGLPRPAPPYSYSLGIIPARAGFTPTISPHGRDARDHPRSRGVYAPAGGIEPPGPGSSPLARGLHNLPYRCYHARGIIPARAGFTRRPCRARRPPRDHPRSRGVYPDLDSSINCPIGSSPLARGLRADPVGAGDAPGSSPLARGLLPCDPHLISHSRIIPARAGFTPQGGAPERRAGDHPRSRGVYHAGVQVQSERPGSSPLARGLPAGAEDCAWVPGIIPARAGFTRLPARPLAHPRDHPRSRGVYLAHTRSVKTHDGSSPLARGLPRTATGLPAARRIIPARAGFTVVRGRGYYARRDHPRSRGVYTRPYTSSYIR